MPKNRSKNCRQISTEKPGPSKRRREVTPPSADAQDAGDSEDGDDDDYCHDDYVGFYEWKANIMAGKRQFMMDEVFFGPGFHMVGKKRHDGERGASCATCAAQQRLAEERIRLKEEGRMEPMRMLSSLESICALAEEEKRWTFVGKLVLRVESTEICLAAEQGYPDSIKCKFFKALLGNDDAGVKIELQAWWEQASCIVGVLGAGNVYTFSDCQVFGVAPSRSQYNKGTVPVTLSFANRTSIKECSEAAVKIG